MKAVVLIRDAKITDAQSISDLLTRSITQLCEPDHNNDSAKIARWLENKTLSDVGKWIGAPRSSLLVATSGGLIVGVSGMTDSGNITLNYVDPAYRFKGISTLMLAALEERGQQRGVKTLTLNSTKTAHAFYKGRGYRDIGSESETDIKMEKALK